MTNCADIKARINEKIRETYYKFNLLFLLTKLYLECLEYITNDFDQPFPKDKEKMLIDEIKDQLKYLQGDLIRLEVRGRKNVVALLDGYGVEQDVAVRKKLGQLLLSSYVQISEEILNSARSGKYVHDRLKKGVDAVAERKGEIEAFGNYDSYNRLLSLKRDVHSLDQIYSIIDTTEEIFKQKSKKVTLDEKTLVLQRVLHVIGEYLKNTKETPNLSDGVRQSLERKGLPSRYLSRFRNLLAHHKFPVLHLGEDHLKQLFSKGLSTIKEIARAEILEIKRDFIRNLIGTENLASHSLGKKIHDYANEHSTKELLEYIRMIRNQENFKTEPIEVRESVRKIYEFAQMLKSDDNFDLISKGVASLKLSDTKSEMSTSVTRLFHDNELKMYDAVRGTLVLWGLDQNIRNFRTSHDDVVKIIGAINYLRYGTEVSSANSIDKFLSGNVSLFNGNSGVYLKQQLQHYFDEATFKDGRPYYSLPQDIEVKSLVDILNSVGGSAETKRKLIKFLESVRQLQITPSVYISPDEYSKSVDTFAVHTSEIEKKLNTFSVDLAKVEQLIELVKSKGSDGDVLMGILNSKKAKILEGGNIKSSEYPGFLNRLHPNDYDKEKSLSLPAESLRADQVRSLADKLGQVEQDVSRLLTFFESFNSDKDLVPSVSKFTALVKKLQLAPQDVKSFIEFRKQLRDADTFVAQLAPIREGSSKLTKFLKHISSRKTIESNYVAPAEYKTLLDGLSINDAKDKGKLMSFSLEWERVKNSIDLLNTIKGSDDGKISLINFFWSADPKQGTGFGYLRPDEYENLIDGLSISAQAKEKLHLFSVDWRRRQCIDLLEGNPTALKGLYDGIIRGSSVNLKSIVDPRTVHVSIDHVSREFDKKIDNLRTEEIRKQYTMLQGLTNSYAAEAQFINVYSYLEKFSDNPDDTNLMRKLRNYLAHVPESPPFRAELLELTKTAVSKLDISTKMSLSTLNQAFDGAKSLLQFSEIRKVLGDSGATRPNAGSTKFNPNLCLKRRQARSLTECLFSREDVEQFSKGKVDENNVEKLRIDSEKFLNYVKSSHDEGKNAQLIQFIGDKSVEGYYRYMVDRVIQDQGYERYVQNERVRDLYGDILQEQQQQKHQHPDVASTKGSKLKGRLLNAAGGIQLLRGIYGTAVSCADGAASDCGLGVGGIAWSLASHPIESVIVKTAPKTVATAAKFVEILIPGTLGKQTGFAVKFVGAKLGGTVAKGIAGAVGGVLDIVDIGMSANNLVDCKNRENSDKPCDEKEIRDNIASISFAGVSFVAGIAFTAASMTGVGIVVGLAIMIGQGVYGGISNIIDYKKKYDTTDDENWSIFWRTLLFQPMSAEVQHLAKRSEIVNMQARAAWNTLMDSPDSVVACAIGLGEDDMDPSLESTYGKILMNRVDADTNNFSRVIPKPIENAVMICLPQSIGKFYEQGITQSVPTAVHYCENTLVIADARRMTTGTTIVYNLRNIDKGIVVGSNNLQNSFLIFDGTTKITGGMNTVNRFIVSNSTRSQLVGGFNATNIFDLNKSASQVAVVEVKVEYIFQTDGILHLILTVNRDELVDDYIGRNPDTFKYIYAGRVNGPDKIECTYEGPIAAHENRNIFVNGGGGLSNDRLDTVDNCRRVTILPYTKVTGGQHEYTFYVKPAGYRAKDLYSVIDVAGVGTISFPETSLLNDCTDISYSFDNNTLTLKIGLDDGNQYALDIRNYIGRDSRRPNFILIDKYGSNIVPKIRHQASVAKINSFELHAKPSLDDGLAAVERHYAQIAQKKNDKNDHHVFGVLTGKSQSKYIFGSVEGDVINTIQGGMFARGCNGSDTYIVDGSPDRREIIIDNDAVDKLLDVLVVPEVPKTLSVRQCDLHWTYGNTHVQVRNYFKDNQFRHLMIMSKAKTFIPYVPSMACTPYAVETHGLADFLHATPTQNIFMLPKDFANHRVVIDARPEEIERYRDKDDLLLVRYGEMPFVIKIEDFYNDRGKWEDVHFLLWNDGDFSTYTAIHDNVDELMHYQDKLRNDYEKSIQEYHIDFTRSVAITHNQDDKLSALGDDEERLGVMILQDIPPDRIKVSSKGNDLVFSDKVSKNVIHVKNWQSSESYRISTLEFDLGLEPIIIRKLSESTSADEIQGRIDKAARICQKRDDLEISTQLPIAVLDGDFSKVKVLLNRCASINAKGKNGFTPLHYGASYGNASVVRYMVEKGADLNALSSDLATPMHSAAMYGHLAVVKYLRESGAALNLRNHYEQTPLHSAAITGKFEVVRYLVEHGANINDKDISNRTPLDFARRKGHYDIVEYLQQQASLISEFERTIDEGDCEMALSLAAKGAYINTINGSGQTILHVAAGSDDPEMVKRLLSMGANVKATNAVMETPLHSAVAEGGNLAIVRLLVDQGADVNAPNLFDQRVLHLATILRRLDMVQYFVEKGADLNLSDRYGNTPLSFATKKSYADIVGYLERQLVKPNKAAQKRRHRRHISADFESQPLKAVNAASRPSELGLMGLFGFVYKSAERLKGLVDGWLNAESHEKTAEISSIAFDANGTILLFDTLIRKATGQKHMAGNTRDITELQAMGYAITITDGFENIVKYAARNGNSALSRLNIDFPKVQREIAQMITGGRYNQISDVLHTYAGLKSLGGLRMQSVDSCMTEFSHNLDIFINRSISSILYGKGHIFELKEQAEPTKPQNCWVEVVVGVNVTQVNEISFDNQLN